MANDQNIYSAGQFYPGFGTNTGIDLANEVKASSQLPVANIATNGITSSQIEKALIQRITVPLSSANLLAMNATPVEVIPAPGAGLTICIIDVLFTMVRTATAYANGGTVVLNYATGPVAAINTIAAAVLTTAGAATTKTSRKGIDAAAVANDAIVITNGTAPFITGTGTASLDIIYRIV
jgi:hypothetical protein